MGYERAFEWVGTKLVDETAEGLLNCRGIAEWCSENGSTQNK